MLKLLGYDRVRSYDGSMREWANREDTPLSGVGRKTGCVPADAGARLKWVKE